MFCNNIVGGGPLGTILMVATVLLLLVLIPLKLHGLCLPAKKIKLAVIMFLHDA